MKGRWGSLGGGMVRPVVSVDSGLDCPNEWTAVRWVLQLEGTRDDVLKAGSETFFGLEQVTHAANTSV